MVFTYFYLQFLSRIFRFQCQCNVQIRSSSKDADLQKILEYVDKSYTSIEEQAAFSIYSATNLNPLFDFQWSRDGLAASKSYADKLIERNDPRLRRIFCIGQGMIFQRPAIQDSNLVV